MSYEIYYDKRFIKVGEDKYIPIFQHGSNNSFEISPSGREIPEKDWSILNYPHKDKYLFTMDEIIKLGEYHKEHCENGRTYHKTRYKTMTPEEVYKMFINGAKNAKPLEFYIDLGNTFKVYDITDYLLNDEGEILFYYPKNTEELVEIIEEKKGRRLSMGFLERNLILPKRQIREKKAHTQDHYYALVNDRGHYLSRMGRGGYYYTYYDSSSKKFRTEKEAIRYLEKYRERLKNFKVERINGEFVYYK